jgi:hypothetical protein
MQLLLASQDSTFLLHPNPLFHALEVFQRYGEAQVSQSFVNKSYWAVTQHMPASHLTDPSTLHKNIGRL